MAFNISQFSFIVLSCMTLGSCKQPTFLTVDAADIPAGSMSLHLNITRDGLPTQAIDPIILPSDISKDYRFVLYLPDDYSGNLQISLGAFDQRNCLLATGDATSLFSPPIGDITVLVKPYSGPPDYLCTSQDLRIRDIQPRLTTATGGNSLTIMGWGFRPGATVSVGTLSAEMTYLSASEISVKIPPQITLGMQPVTIVNPSLESTTRSDLLKIYAGTLALTGFPITPAGKGLSGISALSFGLYDPSTFGNIAIAHDNNQIRFMFVANNMIINSRTKDYTVGMNASALFSVDIDKDGDLDVIVANAASNTVQILTNDGSGLFAPGNAIATSPDPESIIAADLNADGYIDIVTSNKSTNSINVLINDKKGAFGDNGDGLGTGQAPVALAIGDVNDDNLPDIVSANQGDGTLTVFFNDPLSLGHFRNGMQQVLLTVGPGVSSVIMGDTDGNGHADLIASATGSNEIVVFENFGKNLVTPYKILTESIPKQIAFADINADGFNDLLVACSGSSTINVFINKLGAGFRGVAYQTFNAPCPAPSLIGGLDFGAAGLTSIAVASDVCFGAFFNQSH